MNFKNTCFLLLLLKKFEFFDQNILNSMKKNDFIMKPNYILNLLSCTYIKKLSYFKHTFNLLTFLYTLPCFHQVPNPNNTCPRDDHVFSYHTSYKNIKHTMCL